MPEESYRRSLLRYSTIGVEFIALFCLFLGGGFWLDRRLEITPSFTLVGGAIGFAGGLYRMIRQVKTIHRRRPDGGPNY